MEQTSPEVYLRVQHFYARQMQALDNGNYKEYAYTFTPDGVFDHSPGIEPGRTPEGILAKIEEGLSAPAALTERKRHYFNQLVLEPLPDGTYSSTVYALIIRIRPGEAAPEVRPSCVVHDILVVEPTEIHMASRRISYDHLVDA
jgi:actinorhodin biosynthesis protein ActVIA